MPEAPQKQGDENKRALDFIEMVTRNADLVQKRVLSSILSRNAGTEYLSRHGVTGNDIGSFKKRMPVVIYEDIEPDIRRIAEGDNSPIFCSLPITEFLTSSGTSGGQRKLMPTTEDEMGRRTLLYKLLMPVMNQYMKGLDKGKAMYLYFIKAETTTPGGLVARPVLTSYYKSKHFRERPYDPYNVCTSPNETILCEDPYESMYSQLLCGLIQNEEVLRVGAVFASGFIRAIHFLRENWQSLRDDISTGTLNPKIKDPSVRKAVQRLLLQPNPELAELIQRECSAESWEGIITRLWPNTKYIDVIVTGAMAQYIQTLNYYGKGLPLVCTMYASSECYFGLNLNPLCSPSEVSYTLLPNMCYYEFIPVRRSDEQQQQHQQLVDLVDVKIGHEYELVITTYSGLYRYKIGDILRVTGFHNKAPQFQFVCRKNVALSIDADKTDEVELHQAVEKAAEHLETKLGRKLLEYTSHADTSSSVPGHYVLFWELSPRTDIQKASEEFESVLQECCLTVEESLNSVYRQCRVADKSVGALEIRTVEEGTFDAVMDYAVTKGGASINQYKAPRCVKSGPILHLLNSRVVASYFSPRPPTWAPVCPYSKNH